MRLENEFNRAMDQIKGTVRRRANTGKHMTNNDISLINRGIEKAISDLLQFVNKNCSCIEKRSGAAKVADIPAGTSDARIELDLAERNKDLEMRNEELLIRLDGVKNHIVVVKTHVDSLSQFRDKTGMRQPKKLAYNSVLDKLEQALTIIVV